MNSKHIQSITKCLRCCISLRTLCKYNQLKPLIYSKHPNPIKSATSYVSAFLELLIYYCIHKNNLLLSYTFFPPLLSTWVSQEIISVITMQIIIIWHSHNRATHFTYSTQTSKPPLWYYTHASMLSSQAHKQTMHATHASTTLTPCTLACHPRHTS